MAFNRCETRGAARRERQKAEYNANPNYCQRCGKKIEMGLDKLFAVRAKRFCDKICANSARKKSG